MRPLLELHHGEFPQQPHGGKDDPEALYIDRVHPVIEDDLIMVEVDPLGEKEQRRQKAIGEGGRYLERKAQKEYEGKTHDGILQGHDGILLMDVPGQAHTADDGVTLHIFEPQQNLDAQVMSRNVCDKDEDARRN